MDTPSLDPQMDLCAALRCIGSPPNTRFGNVSSSEPGAYSDILEKYRPRALGYASLLRRGAQKGGILAFVYESGNHAADRAFRRVLKAQVLLNRPRNVRGVELASCFEQARYEDYLGYRIKRGSNSFRAAALIGNAVVTMSLSTSPARAEAHKLYFDSLVERFVRWREEPLELAAALSALEQKTSVRAARLREHVRARLEPIVGDHLSTLRTKRQQLVVRDEYGYADEAKWLVHLNEYMTCIVLPAALFRSEEHAVLAPVLLGMMDEGEVALAQGGSHSVLDVHAMSPLDFERFCASLLVRSGWNARVTKASGDQGIDVLASFGSKKAVLQCKKVSAPVGNAAVQQVIAGREFEKADIAAVVSNAPYTSAARHLASAANVHLLHYADLARAFERLREP